MDWALESAERVCLTSVHAVGCAVTSGITQGEQAELLLNVIE